MRKTETTGNDAVIKLTGFEMEVVLWKVHMPWISSSFQGENRELSDLRIFKIEKLQIEDASK